MAAVRNLTLMLGLTARSAEGWFGGAPGSLWTRRPRAGGGEYRYATLLVVDIVDSTRRMEDDEAVVIDAWLRLRRDTVDPAIARSGGRIVKSTGDGLLVEFAAAAAALRCAIDVQRRSRASLPLRAAVHAGSILARREDVYGSCVNVAFRLQEHAEPGGILVSDVVRDRLPAAMSHLLEWIGKVRLRHLDRAVDAFRVTVAD